MGGRPSKALSMVKSHLTKKEREHRQKEEGRLLTGFCLKEYDETKNNPDAHKLFTHLKKLFKKIDKDDDLYSPILNRYCLITAECKEFEIMKASFMRDIKDIEKQYEDDKLDPSEYYDLRDKFFNKYNMADKKIMDKRKILLQLERESIMTIASSMRAIVKKPPEEVNEDPMSALLGS